MSSRKLSKREQEAFDAFKGEFLKWQQKLQCGGYRADFYYGNLDGAYATVDVEEENKTVRVDVDRKFLKKEKGIRSVADSARHEAAHLFLFKLVWLAQRRYLNVEQILHEWERLAVILEKVLK